MKIFRVFIVVALGVLFILTSKHSVFAKDLCTVSKHVASDTTQDVTDQTLFGDFEIKAAEPEVLVGDRSYVIKLDDKSISRANPFQGIKLPEFRLENGSFKIKYLDSAGRLESAGWVHGQQPFSASTHTFSVWDYNNISDARSKHCEARFTINPATRNNEKCTIHFPDTIYDSSRPIKFSVDGLNAKYFVQHTERFNGIYPLNVVIKRQNNSGPEINYQCIDTLSGINDLKTGTYLNTTLEKGYYYVEIRDGCNFEQKALCSNIVKITAPGETGGGEVTTGSVGIKDPRAAITPPCKVSVSGEPYHPEHNPKGQSSHTLCNTGLGVTFDVSSPQDFIKGLFSFILMFAGMAAFLIFIYAGYIYMTSGGDKTKVQAARDTITSAIAGLLFLIFSITILEIIGIDILTIPGFTR